MKASIDALYTLVKTQNPKLTLRQDQIHFNEPVRASYEEHQTHARNTKLTLSVPGLPILGSVDIFYDRLLLKDLLVGMDYGNATPGTVSVPTGSYSVVGDVLPYLNDHYGTTLTAADINANDPVEGPNDGTVFVKGGNLAYDGQCMIVYPNATATDLAEAISVTNVGQIYTGGVAGMVQCALNANYDTFSAFWTDVTATDFTVLDEPTSASHDGSECSAVISYTNISNYYDGSATVYYKRIPINSDKSHTYKVPDGAVNSVDLLRVINARTGLDLTANDVINEALPALVDGTVTYTLRTSPDSFFYTGGLQLTLVDTLPDVATLLTYDADLADSLGPMDIRQRIWNTTAFTDNDYNWLRLTVANPYDPELPLYTVNPAVTNDTATQAAHGGREASVTVTFHEVSGVTGELVFYFNRINLSAVNGGAPIAYQAPDLSILLIRSMFAGALQHGGGPSLNALSVQAEIADIDGMVFVNEANQVPVVFAAKPGSSMFVGEAQVLVSEGATPPSNT